MLQHLQVLGLAQKHLVWILTWLEHARASGAGVHLGHLGGDHLICCTDTSATKREKEKEKKSRTGGEREDMEIGRRWGGEEWYITVLVSEDENEHGL